jgi:hypothetical protein
MTNFRRTMEIDLCTQPQPFDRPCPYIFVSTPLEPAYAVGCSLAKASLRRRRHAAAPTLARLLPPPASP